VDSVEFDVFISYARADDGGGWVSGLRDAIYADFREFSSEPFRIFFDTTEIHSRQDWELRLRHGLRTARVLLVCLSPNYLRSTYCRWEWEEFTRLAARRVGGGDPVTGVYFVELGGDEQYSEEVAAWRHQVERVQLEQLAPWFPDGVTALQNAEVRRRVTALGVGVTDQVRQARLAKSAPGNLRRHNPLFVGRVAELRALRQQLTGGAVGVVTAVHGIGGVGKTELAVTYAHAYAHTYQGGTWQVDADGHTDILEAISTLALWPQLGLTVSDEQLKDRTWLGRRVLARLADLTDTARAQDPDAAACLLLLDNVSEPALLAETQLAVLPNQPWFHLAVTTRLGVSDIGSARSRASVAMIEVGRLDAEDAVALIREHQPAGDPARLLPDFTTLAEAEAARAIVDLLDGYTLAVEQAAVYLGSSGTPPSQLLKVLSEHGTTVLDDVGGSTEGAAAILHKEKLTAVIVDQTLNRLTPRARDALAVASLLPPDTIPWQWLQHLTEPPTTAPPVGRLPGLSGQPWSSTGDDWSSTRRVLEGRRLLTPADDPEFARLHRVLGAHLRTRLADPDTHERLGTHLQTVSEELKDAATPDPAVLAVVATTVANRLDDGHEELAVAALGLIDPVIQRLDLATAHTLATATLNTYQRLAAADPANTGWQRDLAVSLNTVGEVLAAQGDTTAALGHYTAGLHIFERLAAADPTHTGWQRDLSVSLQRVGEVLAAQGDTTAALQHHTRSLHLRERLAAADPANTDWQHNLAGSLTWAGGVLAARGDTEHALQQYTRSLHIVERLAAADPANTELQRDLSVSLNWVGGVLAAQGDTTGALQHHTRSLHLRERVAAANPTHTGWQRDLSVSLNWVGGVLAARGDTEHALQQYTRSLHIVERLAAADPANTGWQRDLSVSLTRVGGVLAAQGDTTAALQQYTRSLHIAERLAAAAPDNTGWQRDLSVSLQRVGEVLAAQGDTTAALQHHTRSLDIVERLAAADPDNTEWQHNLAGSLTWVGLVLAAQGDTTAALQHHTRSLDIVERLAAADPDNTEWQHNLAASLTRVGVVLAAQGDTTAALQHYTRGLDIAERLAAADPDNTEWQHNLADSLTRVGVVLAAQGDTTAALQHHTRRLHIAERLAAADPANTGWQRDLAGGHGRVASLLESAGDPSAVEHWGTAHRILTGLDAAGRLPAGDRQFLDVIAGKLGPT
jgi:tetratricopeptide (TPR) repeat protein